jgi:MutS domain III
MTPFCCKLTASIRKRKSCVHPLNEDKGGIVTIRSAFYPPQVSLWPLITGMPLGTLDNTRTTLGRSLLRTWLLRPSLSIKVINARHDAVECFTRSENLDIANIMHSQLAGIKNIPRILSALRTGKANLANWQGLVKVSLQSGCGPHYDSTNDLNVKVHFPHCDAPG